MRITNRLLFGLFFALAAQPARADDCLNQAVINSIRAKIELHTKDMAQFQRCKANTNTYKLLQALSLIKTMKFSSRAGSLPEPFSQGILSSDFWAYFSRRVSTINDVNGCQEYQMAAVFIPGANDGVLSICSRFYDDAVSLTNRAQALMHEARHFEGFVHVICTRGRRSGLEGNCDDSMEEKGSYAVTVEALAKMSLFADGLSPMDRSVTKLLAMTYADIVFNKPIVPYEMSSIYLVNDKKQSFYFDNSDNSLRTAPWVDTDHAKLISRRFSLTVYPNDKSDAYTLDTLNPAFQKLAALGSIATDYNAMDSRSRPNIVDVLNDDYFIAAVYPDHIQAALGQDPIDTQIPLPSNAVQAFTGAELGEAVTDSIYILNDANQMYRVQLLPGEKYAIQRMDQNLAQGFRALIIFNGQRMGLANNGQIYVNQQGTWVPFAPLQGKTFLSVTRPFQWASYFNRPSSF